MNFDNNIPIYVQLLNQIKIDIISDRLKPGDKLLSVRDYALSYKVNPNTVQKALAELEDIGLILTERTNGKFVTNDKKLIQSIKEKYADELTSKYFSNMNSIGFNKNEIFSYLNRIKEDK